MDLLFHRDQLLPLHPNGMRFSALDGNGAVLHQDEIYSTGGGFIVRAADFGRDTAGAQAVPIRHPFASAKELLDAARDAGLELHELMLENERGYRPDGATRAALLRIWSIMQECIDRGFNGTGLLPGVLKVKRRAARLRRVLVESSEPRPLDAMDWVNAFALAVNEENAAGGRVVTAPTNGAAGIVPAVIAYYCRFEPGASDEGVVRFLLVAGAIGMLYKRNASISGAEMGCQGEVGVACSMAAAGLVAALNGTNEQVENAAEIGMEHNLGLTCDPIAGLVQIPCIERNAMGAVKAINAARLSMRGDGSHKVSAGPGHRDHAADRARHVVDLQGDQPGRPGGERSGVLTGGDAMANSSEGKVAVVTGAFGVLGSAVARKFAALGARVALIDVAPQPSAELAREFGGRHLLLGGVDLADYEATRKAMAATSMRFGGIDILANVAGGFRWEKLEDGDVETWDQLYAMNLRTAVVSCKAALPALLERSTGRIVNIGAGAAAKAKAGMGAYTASKAGVQRLTEALSEEFKDRGITVNAILPGTIDTPRNRLDMPDADFSRWVAPESIAEVIAFLASDAGAAVTGAAIPVFGRG